VLHPCPAMAAAAPASAMEGRGRSRRVAGESQQAVPPHCWYCWHCWYCASSAAVELSTAAGCAPKGRRPECTAPAAAFQMLPAAPAAWGQLAEPEAALQRTEHLVDAAAVAPAATAAHLLPFAIAWCLTCGAETYV
jgi:hypothetical protein